MARDDPTIYMRIPAELKQALERAAEENRRSMTAEVVARLEETFAKASAGRRRTGPPTIGAERLGMTSLPEAIQGSGTMLGSAQKWLRIRALERKNSAAQAEIATCGAAIKRLRIDEAAALTQDDKAAIREAFWQQQSRMYDLQGVLANIAAELDQLYEDVSVDAPGAGSLGSIDVSDD